MKRLSHLQIALNKAWMLFQVVGFTFQPNRAQLILGLRTQPSALLVNNMANLVRTSLTHLPSGSCVNFLFLLNDRNLFANKPIQNDTISFQF